MKSFPELIKEANDQINTVSVEELQSVIDDPNLILVDVQSKDAVEENGMIKNAIHANRGFLEFYFDQRADNPFKKIDSLKIGANFSTPRLIKRDWGAGTRGWPRGRRSSPILMS